MEIEEIDDDETPTRYFIVSDFDSFKTLMIMNEVFYNTMYDQFRFMFQTIQEITYEKYRELKKKWNLFDRSKNANRRN